MGRTDLGTIQVSEGSNLTCYRVTTSLGATIVESIEDIFEIINGSGIFPEYTFVDSDYVIVNANIRSTTNTWDVLTNYNSALLDVTAFRNKEIYIDCNGGYYAFLTAGYTGPGTTPAYAAGYSQQIVLPNTGIMRLRVPYDAVYLYVIILNNGVDSKPYSIRVGSTLKEDNILLDNLKLLSAPLIKNKPGYYLNPTGGEVQASVADIIEYVPVQEGDIFNYRGYTGALGAAVVGYNSNKTFVSLLLPYGNYLDSVNVVIPSGVSYVSFSGRSDYFAFEVRKFIKYADAQQLFNILTFGGNLAGKKLSVISDSITQGVVSGNATPPGEIWVDIVARNLQMELTNYGISGSTIAVAEGNGGMFASLEDLQAAQKEAGKYYTVLTGNQTYQVYYWNGTSLTTSTRKLRTPVSQRYEFMNDDADVIIVWAGSNDFQYNWTPVGTMEDRTNDTFYGALHSLCLGLLSKYLAKPIVFMTPIKRAQTNLDTAADTVAHRGGSYGTPDSKNLFNLTLGEYSDIIKEVCAYYSIPVIDLYSNSILNQAIDSQLSLFDDWRTHPLQKGHEIIARYVLGQLKTIISF